MNYIRKADLYKLIAKLKQNWGLDKNEYNLDIIRALKNFHFFLSGSFSFLLFSNLYLGKS